VTEQVNPIRSRRIEITDKPN